MPTITPGFVSRLRMLRRHGPAGGIVAGGITFSLIVFGLARNWETQHMRAEFKRLSENYAAGICNTFDNDLLVLELIRAFQSGSSRKVSVKEFRAFVQPYFTHRPSLKAVEWIPRISQSQRGALEARMRREGYPAFQITELDSQGRLVRAGARPQYFPIAALEPHQGNEAVLGFDLGSNAIQHEAMQRAAGTGEMVITRQLQLVQGPKELPGFLVFLPVYRTWHGPENPEQRQKELEGFVLGVVHAKDVVERTLEVRVPRGLDTCLWDVSPDVQRQLIYFHPSRTRHEAAPPADELADCAQEVSWSTRIEAGGRRWEIQCLASPSFLATHRTWYPWGLLISGVVLAGLLASHVTAHAVRAAQVERLVEERTARLEQSENRYRTLFESSADGVFLMTDVFLDCNEQVCRMWGDSREVILGRSPWDYTPPVQPDGSDSRESARRHIAAALAGVPQRFEWQHRRADGSLLDTEISLKAVTIDGQPMILATMRDFSERKRMEAALRASEATLALRNRIAEVFLRKNDEAMYAEVLEVLLDTFDAKYGFFGYIDKEGNLVIPLFTRDVWEKCQIPGKSVVFSREKCSGLFCRSLDEKKAMYCNGPLALPEGHIPLRNALVAPILHQGNLIGQIAVANHPVGFTDDDKRLLESIAKYMAPVLHARLERDQLVCERREAYEALYQHAHELNKRVKELNCLYAVSRLLENADFSVEEVLQGVIQLLPPAWQYPEITAARVVFNGRAVATDNYADTSWKQVAPIKVRGEKVGTLEIVYLDSRPPEFEGPFLEEERGLLQTVAERLGKVIERVEAEAELTRAQREAELANQAKSLFLANMSHEIRTPMTAILGFVDILLENVSEPEARDAALIVKRNGEHLLGIINDILDLSKIEAGKLDVEELFCSPAEIVAEVASFMRVRAQGKGLSLIAACDGPIPKTIRTDPTRLRQILTNLVGNAVKFTETGCVRIVTRLRADSDQPRLEVDVIDTGIGMTAEQLDRLFQPFSQGDTSTSRRFGGSGLGLAISKRLAGVLGGDITVESHLGRGSTFRVTVATGPLTEAPMLTSLSETVQASHDGEAADRSSVQLRGRVLLVEDGPDNQRLISLVLRKAGAEVVVAANGQEALEKVLPARPTGDTTPWQGPFDVILMDMQMPVLDGYDTTRRLRAAGYCGPILALTAHAMSHDCDKCLDAGCDDYMTKPIEKAALSSIVSRYLERPLPATPGAAHS